MLLPSFLGSIADKVVDLWEQLNLFGVRDMARRIADAEGHMTASADWQKYKLEQAGASAQEIRKKVRELNRLSDEQVKEVFENAVLTSYENDSKVFEDAGMEPPPFNGDEGRKLLQALYDQTNGELYNFTRTTANKSQTILIGALDDAMLRVTSGLQSKEQAIEQAIEKVAANGLYVEYPSGHRDTIEVAVRRAVRTGVNQASLKMCVNECEAVGTNYVIVSSHLGARTGNTEHANHAGWQGGIYRLKDRKEGFRGMFEEFRDMLKGTNYPLLEEATGYPSDPTGLGGYNCRHNMMPYFPGISENHMKQYDKQENAEAYENSQQQRAKERRMRTLRRQIEALKAAEDADGASDTLVDLLQERRKVLEARYKGLLDDYRRFCKDHGLTQALERTYTAKIRQTEESQDRRIDLDRRTELTINRNGEIKTYKIPNKALDIRISNDAKAKEQVVSNIEKAINWSLNKLGVRKNGDAPKFVIITQKEMGSNSLALYNVRYNTIYVSDVMGNKPEAIRLQEKGDFADPKNPKSTMLHELIHWKDARDYIVEGNALKTAKDVNNYLHQLRNKHKMLLDEEEAAGTNIREISGYAFRKYNEQKYDETYTELRVIRLGKK